MLIHPPPSLRSAAIACLVIAVAASASVSLACFWQLGFGDHALTAFGNAALACWGVAAGTLAAVLGELMVTIQRGPQPKPRPRAGRVASSDLLLTATFLLTGATLVAMGLTMVDRQLVGDGNAPAWFIYTLASALAGLGGMLAAGFFVNLGNRLFRGPTHLDLDDASLRAGGTLRGRLAVPFAATRELELLVELELVRSEPGPTQDDAPVNTPLFQATATTLASIPLAPRRAGAPIEIPLDFEPPADLGDARVAYYWHMAVTPARGDVWWNAVFEPPIDLKP